MNNKIYNKIKKYAAFLMWTGEGKYDNLWGMIIDLIAVNNFIKPIVAGVAYSEERLDVLKTFCKKENLLLGYKKHRAASEEKWNRFSDNKKDETHYTIFISKDQKLIDKAKKMVRWGFTLNKNYNSKDFGKLLGYPSCCLDAYDNKELIYDLKPYICNKIPFYNNILLTGTGSNCRLLSHMVCSFDCKKTIKLNKKVLKAVKKEVPDYYNFLVKHLREPILFWVNGRQGSFGLADSLVVLVFDGNLEGKELKYKKVYINFPINVTVKLTNTPSVRELEDFQKGNKLVIEKKNIKIYKDKKLLRVVKRGKQSAILVDPF
jgi:hypothetical protein